MPQQFMSHATKMKYCQTVMTVTDYGDMTKTHHWTMAAITTFDRIRNLT